MIKILKNVTGSPITLSDVGKTISTGQEFNTVNRQDAFIASNDTLTAIRNGTLQVGDGSKFYTNALEGEVYFRTKFDDNAFLVDGESLSEFNPEVVTDAETGKKACNLFMGVLTVMRELYNAPTDPLYDETFQPLIGVSGREQEHINRTANLENIHAKHGWHIDEMRAGDWHRPLDLLIYYGWLNPFNSGDNAWNNEKVAQDLSKYDLIVLGDGLQNPSHDDYANTQVIIPRIKALNSNTKIFGYVSTANTYANFQTKVDQWNTLQVHGIFMDEAGYDYGTNRADFNQRVDYVHGKTYSNLCFVNAWNMDHIIGTANDASYPNTTWNPDLLASSLTANDWYLLESFPINTTAYSGTGGYESKSDWASRGTKAIGHRYTYGINLAAVGIINNDNGNASALFNFGFISALMFALEGFGTSDTDYGASSAAVTFRTRPNTFGFGKTYAVSPSVQNDVNDNDVYVRFTDYAKFLLDFSSGAQLSGITKYYESGVSGYSGYSGYSGIGTSGYSGVSGTSGYSGALASALLVVPFYSGTVTLTNMPAGDTELPATQYRLLLDLANFTQFRVTMRVNTAGYTGSDLRFQYATSDGGSYANIDGNSGPEIDIGSTGEKDSGWVSLVAGARANNIRVRMMGKDGNGTADPVIRQVMLHFK